MMCKQPFMRDHRGKIRWSTKMTPEERLQCTPFPCGNCLPCRINRARVWQHRIMLELKSHTVASFITLTYDDDRVPKNKSGQLILRKTDFQKFMKRLRRNYELPLRYLGVGEYGERYERPHFHAILFGIGPLSQATIEKSWSDKKGIIGNLVVGTVTPASARYCAGYCIKKLTKEGDPRLDGRTPEFMLSSRKDGGIGKAEVIRIAKQIKENPYWDENTIINSFTIGGKPFPLGGYLSNILFEELGQSEELKQSMLWAYQQKLYNENAAHTVDYYHNIINNSEQRRLNMETKQKLFKQKRIL